MCIIIRIITEWYLQIAAIIVSAGVRFLNSVGVCLFGPLERGENVENMET